MAAGADRQAPALAGPLSRERPQAVLLPAAPGDRQGQREGRVHSLRARAHREGAARFRAGRHDRVPRMGHHAAAHRPPGQDHAGPRSRPGAAVDDVPRGLRAHARAARRAGARVVREDHRRQGPALRAADPPPRGLGGREGLRAAVRGAPRADAAVAVRGEHEQGKTARARLRRLPAQRRERDGHRGVLARARGPGFRWPCPSAGTNSMPTCAAITSTCATSRRSSRTARTPGKGSTWRRRR